MAKRKMATATVLRRKTPKRGRKDQDATGNGERKTGRKEEMKRERGIAKKKKKKKKGRGSGLARGR